MFLLRRRWPGFFRFMAAFFLLASFASAQQANTPHLGYVYPAGGRQGSTFPIVLGGEFLQGATNVYVNGDGIQAAVLEYDRPMPQKEFNELRDQLRELMQKRRAAGRAARRNQWRNGAGLSTNSWTAADQKKLVEIGTRLLKNPPNRQGNPALAETVLVQVTLATNAAPGPRELRLESALGLSNPMAFRIGQLPEYSRPADRTSSPELNRLRKQFGLEPQGAPERPDMRITLPATVNGQILPGGMDGYRFWARRGQQLVITVAARELIPYLADAVPGWFQATLSLCDAKGNELAYAGRYQFHPDPVLHFEVPKDGEYLLRIRDSLYRGREDFVYRMTLGELPFVTSLFPMGGPAGARTAIHLQGWNLTATNLVRDDANAIGVSSFSSGGESGSGLLRFAVDDLPERVESSRAVGTARGVDKRGRDALLRIQAEPDAGALRVHGKETNNPLEFAQPIELPLIVNGRIDPPGDIDVFRFRGHAGQQVVAEVLARRLGSPLDSTLKLTDAAGGQLAFNDDHEDKSQGLETDHADSWLCAKLPADGTYFVWLGDAQHAGGADYGYRLRVSAPRPDFALRIAPSSINVRAGLSVPITVYALRQDGCTNAIELELNDAPAGFRISGGFIPANQDEVRLTLSAPARPPIAPVSLALEGRAVIQGESITRQAVPADDRMQAFAYQHLVCAQELKVDVLGKGWPRTAPALRISSDTPVKIPSGGTAHVRIAGPLWALTNRFDLELSEPPNGITLQSVTPVGREIELALHCDAAPIKPGANGNLIVQLVPRLNPTAAKRKPAANQHRPPAGALPAIPFQVVSLDTD
jgi:hypothetical protein